MYGRLWTIRIVPVLEDSVDDDRMESKMAKGNRYSADARSVVLDRDFQILPREVFRQ